MLTPRFSELETEEREKAMADVCDEAIAGDAAAAAAPGPQVCCRRGAVRGSLSFCLSHSLSLLSPLPLLVRPAYFLWKT